MKNDKSLKTQQLNTEQIISEQLLHGNIPIKKLAILLTNDIYKANNETMYRKFNDLYNGDVPNIKLDTLKDFFHVESCKYEIAEPVNLINSGSQVYKNKICVSVVVDKNINVNTPSGKQKLSKGAKIKLNLKQNYVLQPNHCMIRPGWDYDSISYQPLNKDNKRSLETNHIKSQINHSPINNKYLQSKVKKDAEKKIKTETEKCIQEMANKDFHCSAFELKEFIEKNLPKGDFNDKLNFLKNNKNEIESKIIKQRKENNIKFYNFRYNLVTKQKQHINRLVETRLLYANKAKNLIKKNHRENLQNVKCNNKPLINNFFK